MQAIVNRLLWPRAVDLSFLGSLAFRERRTPRVTVYLSSSGWQLLNACPKGNTTAMYIAFTVHFERERCFLPRLRVAFVILFVVFFRPFAWSIAISVTDLLPRGSSINGCYAARSTV